MTLVVFAGPTIPHRQVAALLQGLEGLLVLPPAAQGDLYRAARRSPRAIALIDGYFEGRPSVWHKEVLWALQQGVHVFGASSMGALRAAELEAFGMVGVGEIFAGFRDGVLEDDDEVAVQHGPPETGYVALNEAMVNIRATLAAAEADGILDTAERAALELAAKSRFYPERSWEALLEQVASEDLLSEAKRAALRAWLPAGRIDAKRADAEALLDHLGAFLAGEPEPHAPGFAFEHTALWDDAVAEAWASDQEEADGPPLRYQRVLDEVRLQGPAFADLRRKALGRFCALGEVERQRLEAPIEELRERLTDFRLQRGLTSRRALDAWLAAQDLDGEGLEALMAEEVLLTALERRAGPELGEALLAELRLTGAFAALAERARDKERALAESGLAEAGPAETGQPGRALVEWFFLERLEAQPPDDLRATIAAWGLKDEFELYRLLAREYLYWRGRERNP